MALTLINDNLVLSQQQFEWVSAVREAVGYHHYYTGDGIIENPYGFNLSTSIIGGDIVITVVLKVPDKNKKFEFSLQDFTEKDAIAYKSMVDSSNKMKAEAKTIVAGNTNAILSANSVVIPPGTHVFRVFLERQIYFQFYFNDKPFLQKSARKFSSLRRIVIAADALTVYEAHFTDMKGRRAYVFTGNGLEVPLLPVLYPGTYFTFSGKVLDNKRSWVQVRRFLKQTDPTEIFYIRKAAIDNKNTIQGVINVYERHYAVWTDEGFQAVYETKIREPRSLSIYEFIMDAVLLSIPSS